MPELSNCHAKTFGRLSHQGGYVLCTPTSFSKSPPRRWRWARFIASFGIFFWQLGTWLETGAWLHVMWAETPRGPWHEFVSVEPEKSPKTFWQVLLYRGRWERRSHRRTK